MSDKLVSAILETRLLAFADDNDLPVAFENVRFDQADSRHLECFVLPATTITQTLDGVHRCYRGVFQVNIVFPKNVGTGEASDVAKALGIYFPVFSSYSTDGFKVAVASPVSVGPVLQRELMAVMPTSIRYRADAI